MAFYSRFARFIRTGYKALHFRWRVDTRHMPDGAAVYIVHHQNMVGPVHFLGLMPNETHMWSLHVFLNRKACFDQFYHYTFRERHGWPRFPSFCAAKALSFLVPAVLNSFDVVPVYRGEANLLTIRGAMTALLKGESMTICPDTEYASKDPAMGEMYTGFLVLGALYEKKTGKPLPFVPVYVSRKQRRIVLGEPMTMESGIPLDEAGRGEMARRIAECVNALGRECGDIAEERQ